MTPLILDELLDGKNISRLLAYTAVIIAGNAFLSLLGSITDVVMEKYNKKMENFFTEAMSFRVMELDFQLTEDKKALDQIEKARTGMGWYSGSVYGISIQVFQIIANIIKIVAIIVLILTHAPVLFAITSFLLIINMIINSKENLIEIEAFHKLSKSNRIFGYLAWELVDFRYGKGFYKKT